MRVLRCRKTNYGAFFDVDKVYTAMLKRKMGVAEFKTPEYAEKRSRLVDYIYKTSERLRISENSAQLGVLLMDLTMTKRRISPNDLRLFAASSFLLACTPSPTIFLTLQARQSSTMLESHSSRSFGCVPSSPRVRTT